MDGEEAGHEGKRQVDGCRQWLMPGLDRRQGGIDHAGAIYRCSGADSGHDRHQAIGARNGLVDDPAIGEDNGWRISEDGQQALAGKP